jgi:hypothetical protein
MQRKSVCRTMHKVSLLLTFLIFLNVHAQQPKAPPHPAPLPKATIAKADMAKLKLMEDTLRQLSNDFTDDTLVANRQKSCYAFIPKLVHALKYDNSFFYPFDSVETVSKIYPPDSSFRILTWQLFYNRRINLEARYSKTGRDTFFEKPVARYYGVIQMRSKEMKIFPLFDVSDTLSYGTQQILGPGNWWGELYYNIIEKEVDGKNYYTLFGFQAIDQLTRRKIIDVLTFDSKGTPLFGAPLFRFKYEDSSQAKLLDTLTRFNITYKFDAQATLNYDPELEMIVFDHVAPPNNKAQGATFTYVPDGTYEGFKWITNHWQWIEKVFTFAINEDDNPPIPVPLFGTPKKQPQLPGEGDPR